MLNNLGNNGEALRVLRTESLQITLPDIFNSNVFNLGNYIKSVQDQFQGKQVTKVHIKAVKETLLPSSLQVVGIYTLDGFDFIPGETMNPPVPILDRSRCFLLNNNEELEFYGNTNFNGISIIPVGNGNNIYGSGYLVQPPTSPALAPPIENFRLQITLMGL